MDPLSGAGAPTNEAARSETKSGKVARRVGMAHQENFLQFQVDPSAPEADTPMECALPTLRKT